MAELARIQRKADEQFLAEFESKYAHLVARGRRGDAGDGGGSIPPWAMTPQGYAVGLCGSSSEWMLVQIGISIIIFKDLSNK
mgnify:CR=1 FL=1